MKRTKENMRRMKKRNRKKKEGEDKPLSLKPLDPPLVARHLWNRAYTYYICLDICVKNYESRKSQNYLYFEKKRVAIKRN